MLVVIAIILVPGIALSWAVHSSWRQALVGALAFTGAIVLALVVYFAFFVVRRPAAIIDFMTFLALLPVVAYGVGLYRFGPKLRRWVRALGGATGNALIGSGNLLDAVLGRHAVIDSISPDGVIRFRLVGRRAQALIAYRIAQLGLFLGVFVLHDEILAAFGRAFGRYLRAQIGFGG